MCCCHCIVLWMTMLIHGYLVYLLMYICFWIFVFVLLLTWLLCMYSTDYMRTRRLACFVSSCAYFSFSRLLCVTFKNTDTVKLKCICYQSSRIYNFLNTPFEHNYTTTIRHTSPIWRLCVFIFIYYDLCLHVMFFCWTIYT